MRLMKIQPKKPLALFLLMGVGLGLGTNRRRSPAIRFVRVLSRSDRLSLRQLQPPSLLPDTGFRDANAARRPRARSPTC